MFERQNMQSLSFGQSKSPITIASSPKGENSNIPKNNSILQIWQVLVFFFFFSFSYSQIQFVNTEKMQDSKGLSNFLGLLSS